MMTFRFFDLPRELRDRIYRYSLLELYDDPLRRPDTDMVGYDVWCKATGLSALAFRADGLTGIAFRIGALKRAVQRFTALSFLLTCHATYSEVKDLICRVEATHSRTWELDCIAAYREDDLGIQMHLAWTAIPPTFKPKPRNLILNMRFMADHPWDLGEDLETDAGEEKPEWEIRDMQREYCEALTAFIKMLGVNALYQRNLVSRPKMYLISGTPLMLVDYCTLTFEVTTRETSESVNGETPDEGLMVLEGNDVGENSTWNLSEPTAGTGFNENETNKSSISISAKEGDDSDHYGYNLYDDLPALFICRKLYHICHGLRIGSKKPSPIVNGRAIELEETDNLPWYDSDEDEPMCFFQQSPDFGLLDDHGVASCRVHFENLDGWWDELSKPENSEERQWFRRKYTECPVM